MILEIDNVLFVTDYIKTVDLPSRSDANISFAGTSVVVAGWGTGNFLTIN